MPSAVESDESQDGYFGPAHPTVCSRARPAFALPASHARTGVEPAALALVAAHAWDCHGAHRAGRVTGWVSRHERRFNPALGRPDVSGGTLDEVAAGLLGLPGAA